MWTQFWDMHSGGGCKEAPYEQIFIEAPEEEAKVIFYNRFGHNPERVSCTCCGEDYSISEDEELNQLTGYHRGCAYEEGRYVELPDREYDKNKKLITPQQFAAQKDVLIIPAEKIKPAERVGEVPEQGYVWRG